MITSNTTSEDRVSIVTTLCSQCHIPSITMWFPQPTFITASHPYKHTVGQPLILKLLGRPHKIDFTIAFDILERDGTDIDNVIWNQSVLFHWLALLHISQISYIIIEIFERGEMLIMLTHWGPFKMRPNRKCIFLKENVRTSIDISLDAVPMGSINNIPALVQLMAWCQLGDKALFEPMMIRLTMHICITWPQWVIYRCIDFNKHFSPVFMSLISMNCSDNQTISMRILNSIKHNNYAITM